MEEKSVVKLSNFQSWMQQQLLDPYGMVSAEKSGVQKSVLVEDLVCDSKRLSARDHLAIYQRSYIARLRDCMSKVFSALEYALGEELFEGFADTYLEMYPSSNYNLSGLGAKFANFLETTRPDIHEEVKEDWPDFMIELAKFEFSVNTLFDQEDTSKYALATMETKEENLCLVSVIELFEFRFPVRPFYSAFVNEEQPDFPALQQSYSAIVRQRHNYRIALFDLQSAQYHFLKQLQLGKSVREALDFIAEKFAQEETKLQSFWTIWKETWIQSGFFADSAVLKG
ncbi:MAG: putative DNA-binding domain-containing protein [Flavobacteriaceae bacterium]|nr:putative DNA-binding domain-containing protein [Flavobacteriaceae bacterium]